MEGSGEIILPCPVCGIEIADLDELWREIHVRDCLARNNPSMLQPCGMEKCQFCGKKLSSMSADFANRHINQCMDKRQKRVSESRSTERCPFCGQNLRDMKERQRKIHDQTCQGISRAREAEVVSYPKVIESLPTPAEWELEKPVEPVFVVNDPLVRGSDVPQFGRMMMTWDLQGLGGFGYQHLPFNLAAPKALDGTNEIELLLD
jgi:hypothetical protein